MENKPEDFESKRNVSDEWIRNNVYEALETIELAERRMRNGCADLIEYIRELALSPHRIPEIQLKNMGIMIVEFDILIENTKEIVKETQYNEARKNLNLYSSVYDNGKVYKIVKNIRDKRVKKRIVLTKVFWKLSNDLSVLRSKMVSNLAHILFLKDREKEKEEKGED